MSDAKPWVVAYYFHGGEQTELVYATTAAEARAKATTIPAVHSVKRATPEQVAELLATPPPPRFKP